MRFEEAVKHRVVGFPQPRVSEHERAVPRVSQSRIDAGIARGRELHAAFCRRAVQAVAVELPAAALRFAGRLAVALAREFQKERARLATSRSLSALDDRMLRDIGVERGDIPYIARTLAYWEKPAQPAVVKTLEPKLPVEIVLPRRAACAW